jgi:hypothetical protein
MVLIENGLELPILEHFFSSNGQETIYHFTKDNSPLPSNTINDIEINETTGEIYFATDKGMISLKGIATKPADNKTYMFILIQFDQNILGHQNCSIG